MELTPEQVEWMNYSRNLEPGSRATFSPVERRRPGKGGLRYSRAEARRNIITRSGIEYEDWAVNFIEGCQHACIYCYARLIKHYPTAEWRQAQCVPEADKKLRRNLQLLEEHGLLDTIRQQHQCIMVSSSHDPLQPCEAGLFPRLLGVLEEFGVSRNVMILTKSNRAELYLGDIVRAGCWYGATITSLDPELANVWEPGAPPPDERLRVLRLAKQQGIRTWAAIEPILPGTNPAAIITAVAPLVDYIVVGKLSHRREARQMAWPYIAETVYRALAENRARFLIKRELRKHLRR